MASYVFDHIKLKVITGQIDLSGVPDGSYKMALVTSAVFANEATGSLSNYTKWSEISNYEIIQDSSYNSEGYNEPQSLTNVGIVEKDVNGYTQVYVSATDIVFPVSKIDADGAVIFKNDVNKTLYQAMDFDGKQSSNNGIFSVPMANNGFLRII